MIAALIFFSIVAFVLIALWRGYKSPRELSEKIEKVSTEQAYAEFKGYLIPMSVAQKEMWKLMDEKEKNKALDGCIKMLKAGAWVTEKQDNGDLKFVQA